MAAPAAVLDVPVAVGFELIHLLEFRPGEHGAWALLGLLYLALVVRRTRPAVAHALSVIVVQSDGAAYAAEHRADDNRTLTVGALKTISASMSPPTASCRSH